MGWLTEIVETSVRKVFDEKVSELENKITNTAAATTTTNTHANTDLPPPPSTTCPAACHSMQPQPLEDIEKICKSSSFPFEKFLEYEEAKMKAEAKQQFGWSATAFASTSLVVGAFSIRFKYLPIITLIPLSAMGLHATYLWSRGYGNGSSNVFQSIKQIMNDDNDKKSEQ